MNPIAKVFLVFLFVGILLCASPYSQSIGIVMALVGGVGFIVFCWPSRRAQ